MDLYDIMINAISQREKDKYDFTYMWSSKSERNEQTTKQMTQREDTGREEGGGFRMGNMCIPVVDSC